MTDLAVTAADVRPLSGAVLRRFSAGGTIAVGAAVYVSGNDEVSAANGGTITTAKAVGVLVGTNPNAASQTAAASGDAVDVCVFGPVAGFTPVANTIYYIKDTDGVIQDSVGTKDCMIGIGLSTSVLFVRPQQIDFA